jgi:hypothetical protein
VVPAYLQLRHAANELVGHLDIRAAGVVQGDELGGQVLVAVEQPGVQREEPGKAGSQQGGGTGPSGLLIPHQMTPGPQEPSGWTSGTRHRPLYHHPQG